jgi:hypothetical protein
MKQTTQSVELRVANLDCEHAPATIERGLSGLPGLAERVPMNPVDVYRE